MEVGRFISSLKWSEPETFETKQAGGDGSEGARPAGRDQGNRPTLVTRSPFHAVPYVCHHHRSELRRWREGESMMLARHGQFPFSVVPPLVRIQHH